MNRLFVQIGVAAITAATTFLALSPAARAASLPSVPYQGYALWPPNYCSKGDGIGTEYGSASYVTVAARTWSLRAPSGPTCETASGAATNTFAAYVKLMKYTSSGLGVCRYGDHEVNAYGAHFVSDSIRADDCGRPGDYAIRAEWRITYGGSNQYGDDTGGAWTWNP